MINTWGKKRYVPEQNIEIKELVRVTTLITRNERF